jgi:MFS family permease
VLLAVSPFVVVWLAAHQTPIAWVLGFLFFLLEGISTYLAGTAYLALIADQTSEQERGPATGVVWTMLMVGIIITGIGTGAIMDTYSFPAFVTLTVTGAVVAAVLAAVALHRQEPRLAAAAAPRTRSPACVRGCACCCAAAPPAGLAPSCCWPCSLSSCTTCCWSHSAARCLA